MRAARVHALLTATKAAAQWFVFAVALAPAQAMAGDVFHGGDATLCSHCIHSSTGTTAPVVASIFSLFFFVFVLLTSFGLYASRTAKRAASHVPKDVNQKDSPYEHACRATGHLLPMSRDSAAQATPGGTNPVQNWQKQCFAPAGIELSASRSEHASDLSARHTCQSQADCGGSTQHSDHAGAPGASSASAPPRLPREQGANRAPSTPTTTNAGSASGAASGFYVTIQEEDLEHTEAPPIFFTVPMEEFLEDLDEEDTVLCMDGENIFSAFKPMYLPEVLTAYKRVDRKVKPVPAVYPEDAKVERRIPDPPPLASLQPLPIRPPEFMPDGGRLTEERLKEMNINPQGFLWPEEEKLFKHVLQLHQNSFVWEDHQRGSFREDYFSPYIIPVVPHIPWAFPNIPIPPGIRDKVVQLLREKIEAGVYEPSQSSYRSRWFCVLKKSGKLRIVHDLQPLNKVTIRDAGLPPNLDSFVEPFAGHQCYTVFDLYWGFDARKVHPKSRDLTAFLTPLGLLRITSLPTGFTNSPAEFQACMSFILKDEIPHKANIFIDDLPIKGSKTQYPDAAGNPQTMPDNPGIRRFIWEHANDVHRIIHRVSHAGGTFSPTKVQLAQPEVLIVGQKCTPEGRLPDEQKVEKILSWPPLKTVKDVRAFLGLCGTVRIWIENYSVKTRPLTELIRRDIEFEWNERRQAAFDQLKQAITTPPALRAIDYQSESPVILSVDSSYIAVGFILSQLDEQGRRHPARYGSLPMNEREARYSQPKLELYGLYRALRAYRVHLIGVRKLIVEVDAKYIRGMLNYPDLQPNATINRWIQGIFLFDFELVHVPAERHKGPDALSRKELAEGEAVEEEDDSWLDDIALMVQTASYDAMRP